MWSAAARRRFRFHIIRREFESGIKLPHSKMSRNPTDNRTTSVSNPVSG
jgi:hypothetical protein